MKATNANPLPLWERVAFRVSGRPGEGLRPLHAPGLRNVILGRPSGLGRGKTREPSVSTRNSVEIGEIVDYHKG